MKLLSLLVAVSAISAFAGTRQLMVDQKNAKSWKGMVQYEPKFARGKGPCFVLFGKYPTPLIYGTYFPVSPDKIYTLKASFRSMDQKLEASGYLGLELYDENKRLLGFRNVSPFAKTESTVVSAEKGQRFLVIKKFPSFNNTIKTAVVAFNTKADFSDIPNFDLSPQSTAIKDEGENLKIELRSPLKKSYPAGTPVRLHSPWSPSMYYLVSGWMPAGEGKSFTVKLHGINTEPGTPRSKFWKGTKYVRPFIWFGNWNRRPKEGAKLLVDGFSFEETDMPGK